jgi:hypothetical protein
MSDVDPTPDTPVTVGDRLAWFRGDIVERMTTLEALVAANHTATLAAIAALRGVNNATLSTLLTEDQFDTSGRLINSNLLDINDKLDKIQEVLGADPYSSTETGNIRALLLTLALGQHSYGIAPDYTEQAKIAAVGTVAVGGWRYLRWSVSDTTHISADNYTVTPNPDWSGGEIYVQTNAPTFELYDFATQTVTELVSCSWHVLDEYGSRALAFRVASNFDATGTLRLPTSTPM